MQNTKIKVLGIAPYEAMKTAMQKIADVRNDIELDVYAGDLNYGVEIVRHNIQNNYDAIISRGGTAEMIGRMTNIPVVEITLSVYDILRAIKLAENYSDHYAIIGFPSITESAHLLCSLLQYKLDIVTAHSEEEVISTLTQLKQDGYHMVIGDMITHTTAKNLGLNAILITSGTESIVSAFDQAVKISTSYLQIKQENKFLKEVIDKEGSKTIIFSEKGEIYLSTWDQENAEGLYMMLRVEIPQIISSDNHKMFRNINGILFSIIGRLIDYQKQTYIVYYVTASKIPIANSKYGINFFNKKEAEEQLFNSFYSITGAMGGLQDSINQLSLSSFPVMLTGENGTGKEQIAFIIYTHSPHQTTPFVTIDCELLNDKSWEYLTNHYNSPFNDNNNTIYFKSIETLSKERSQLLLSLIIDINLSKRNRLIFSCTTNRDALIPAVGQEFVKRLSCLTICPAPLRERAMEIPSLSSIYLGSLNVEMGKQLIGFEPKAMELLQEYDWPQNYTQFKRLLNELATLTTTPYITSLSVMELLDKERNTIGSGYSSAPDSKFSLNLNRTLDEITHDIILQVLAGKKGNQSAVAKQLGISRTTLWRYLNRL
ncbi:sigma-54-dependent transcriptional regulator [Anaerocolumna sedimenticola]|uniref:Sigma-54-dependent transcriptional regulator n=1 Tax=Anaerocolumna sedimenticola TaxID=2696063 RepID=A0A6P1TUS3_9FIRM|nr:sigma-54-dependent transcriptional regulator [Anaerocolumna sedimenticola]QHQ63238.1 sigma-54-dependent transcriptional regulator [Anaerocolumna sedimenticola]